MPLFCHTAGDSDISFLNNGTYCRHPADEHLDIHDPAAIYFQFYRSQSHQPFYAA